MANFSSFLLFGQGLMDSSETEDTILCGILSLLLGVKIIPAVLALWLTSLILTLFGLGLFRNPTFLPLPVALPWDGAWFLSGA